MTESFPEWRERRLKELPPLSTEIGCMLFEIVISQVPNHYEAPTPVCTSTICKGKHTEEQL